MPHTPGPWAWDGYGDVDDDWILNAVIDGAAVEVFNCGSGDGYYGNVWKGTAPKPDDRALIAAAPELLAAAELALSRIESDIESPGRTVAEGDALRRAIRKATALLDNHDPDEG